MNVKEFTQKWTTKFQDPEVCYIDLVDHYMADDCQELGFEMDCGHAFHEQYGEAVYDVAELQKIIMCVSDINLLGSAIYSRWRYFNHWAYSADEILKPENREWFIIALKRLKELA